MKSKYIILLIIILLLSGCIRKFPENYKSNDNPKYTNYSVIKVEGHLVYYLNSDNLIDTKSIQDNNFYIIESNNTVLQYQTANEGLYNQWILYLKPEK